MNEALRAELKRMAREDQETREELLRAGKLPQDGYDSRMRRVHERNNSRLREIVAQHGWPGRSVVGEDGCEAAWLVVQHAVLEPEFQRECLGLLERAVASGEAQGWQLAYLTDRVLMYEGKAQIYGTQYVPVEGGKSAPYTIAEPEHVDARRRAVGLCSLAENTRRIQAEDELLNANL
ncbi:MAG TPA: DUF6624 domain-containing protein [Pyrinomonadaceae bacterium]|jgi:phage-related minor tail protein